MCNFEMCYLAANGGKVLFTAKTSTARDVSGLFKILCIAKIRFDAVKRMQLQNCYKKMKHNNLKIIYKRTMNVVFY